MKQLKAYARSKLKAIMLLSLLVVLLVGCSSPPQPLRLSGIWGGVMSYGGVDGFVFAVDVTTSAEGSVSGYGVFTSDPTLERMVFVTVTGNTQPTSVSMTLRDLANDTIQLSGTLDGAVVRGTWVYATLGMSGNFRMVAEENVDLLGRRQLDIESSVFSSMLSSLIE